MRTLEEIESSAGLTFLDYQRDTLTRAAGHQGPSQRLCLYYKTGAGKTYTSLAALRLWGWEVAVVIAPPSTHAAWEAAGDRLGVQVQPMSHATFRMAKTKLARDVPVIADEFHLFGGHGGKGWQKFDGLARGLKAPIILCSATPNYNDAERVYCIHHVLDPHSCKGGYLAFLNKHCTTEVNPFAMLPVVTGFQAYASAADYLAALPGVEYLPDDLVYTIEDIEFSTPPHFAFEVFGYDKRTHRIMASGMEERHKRIFNELVNEHGLIQGNVFAEIEDLRQTGIPVLIYANHSTVAEALGRTFAVEGVGGVRLVTGATSKPVKAAAIQHFIDGDASILIGTASLATGTDGMDKVCDRLIILDDTDDDSLRRQLIGRIMPRGMDTDASKKQVFRLVRK